MQTVLLLCHNPHSPAYWRDPAGLTALVYWRMNRDAVDGWCERGILALVLVILVFAPLATGAVRAIDFAVVEFLAAGVLLLWAVRFWVNPRPKLLLPSICWAVLAFVVYAL